MIISATDRFLKSYCLCSNLIKVEKSVFLLLRKGKYIKGLYKKLIYLIFKILKLIYLSGLCMCYKLFNLPTLFQSQITGTQRKYRISVFRICKTWESSYKVKITLLFYNWVWSQKSSSRNVNSTHEQHCDFIAFWFNWMVHLQPQTTVFA